MSKAFVRLFVLLMVMFPMAANADDLLPTRMEGVWSGQMEIWSKGVKRDVIPVVLTIAPRGADRWQWKMEYRSKTNPMVKDYELRLKDRANQTFITDEGDGLLLEDYAFGNKMVSQFETQGVWLTSTHELLNGRLIFEVTAGKRSDSASKGVANITITSLQRAVMKRVAK